MTLRSPHFALRRLLVFLLGFCAGTAAAATKPDIKPDTAPEIVRTATGVVEVGTLRTVPYRIDIPTAWQQSPRHGLVIFFHGYAETVPTFRVDKPLNEQAQALFDRGYAVAQSAFSTSGWALAEGYAESELLRTYFVKQYAAPVAGKKGQGVETIAAGASMGGALVVATLELNPGPYAGGLDLCGSVGPTDLALQRRFAWRAAFDFYFPGLMPPLVPGGAEYPPAAPESPALRERAEEALRANPAAAAAMRSLMSLHTDREVARNMVYFTFVLQDMQHRSNGNPFDNRNFLYSGASPTSSAVDNALNDGVRRYVADPRARDYLLHHYTPTGRMTLPMLALHTTYDPVIPPGSLSVYNEQVAIAGYALNLVQQYVRRDGHCAFTTDEIGRSFDELLLWVHTGRRPTPGPLPPARGYAPSPDTRP